MPSPGARPSSGAAARRGHDREGGRLAQAAGLGARLHGLLAATPGGGPGGWRGYLRGGARHRPVRRRQPGPDLLRRRAADAFPDARIVQIIRDGRDGRRDARGRRCAVLVQLGAATWRASFPTPSPRPRPTWRLGSGRRSRPSAALRWRGSVRQMFYSSMGPRAAHHAAVRAGDPASGRGGQRRIRLHLRAGRGHPGPHGLGPRPLKRAAGAACSPPAGQPGRTGGGHRLRAAG